MSRQCPSCKMESPDDARWCEFCKEPFRDRIKQAEEEAVAKVAERLKAGEPLSEEELKKRLPPEFLKGDDGMEKLPALPPWFKWLAWAFLASWLISGLILAGVMMGRKKLAEPPPDTPGPMEPGGYNSGPVVVPNR